jgi:hypothetical protein
MLRVDDKAGDFTARNATSSELVVMSDAKRMRAYIIIFSILRLLQGSLPDASNAQELIRIIS